MRPGQITDAHQKLVDDLPAGKTKGLSEDPRPILHRSRVIGREPAGKRAVRLPERLDAFGVKPGFEKLEIGPALKLAAQERAVALKCSAFVGF